MQHRTAPRAIPFLAFLLAACFLSAGAGSAAAAAPALNLHGYGLKIFRVESALYPFVHVYIRTFDQDMEPLVNLNRMNIGLMVRGRVYDPAKKQYLIQPLRSRPEAVRTVLVIDTARTMAGPRFEAALRAAARFIDAKRPQDQVAIVALADNPDGYAIVSNFERDYGALGRRLADLHADTSASRLYDAVAAAMELTAATGPGGDSLSGSDYVVSTSVVVFSDGHAGDSALSRSDLMTRISGLSVPIPIYALGFGPDKNRDLRNLQALARNSFGKYYRIGRGASSITRSIEDIQNILLSDYVVTFRAYVPVDGERYPLKVGFEYPTGSGKMRYDSAFFETMEPPNLPQVLAAQQKLDQAIPALADSNPFLGNPYTISRR